MVRVVRSGHSRPRRLPSPSLSGVSSSNVPLVEPLVTRDSSGSTHFRACSGVSATPSGRRIDSGVSSSAGSHSSTTSQPPFASSGRSRAAYVTRPSQRPRHLAPLEQQPGPLHALGVDGAGHPAVPGRAVRPERVPAVVREPAAGRRAPAAARGTPLPRLPQPPPMPPAMPHGGTDSNRCSIDRRPGYSSSVESSSSWVPGRGAQGSSLAGRTTISRSPRASWVTTGSK